MNYANVTIYFYLCSVQAYISLAYEHTSLFIFVPIWPVIGKKVLKVNFKAFEI